MLGAMELDITFVTELEAIDPKELMKKLQSDNRPNFDTFWKIKNEIKPVDLFCYLYARFGPPNGIQNLFRSDSSDNLIHWEWALQSQERILLIQGQNFRTEIWMSGKEQSSEEKDILISAIKDTFSSYGTEMGEVRKSLEHWIEFINPYQRIRRSIESLTKELESLNIDGELENKKDLHDYETPQEWADDWKKQSAKYSKATGLCFGIRSMLPVMAEAFVNLLLYMLLKPALKKDDRLRENIIRQPIDVRIKSLSHNCIGFKQDIDYSDEVCKLYHSIVNERNDLLHGNVVIDKLKFNEVNFSGKVPVFKTYSTMWERAFGVELKSVGLERLKQERNIVEELIEYIISHMNVTTQNQVKALLEHHELGMCIDDGHLGILFSSTLVDMQPGPRGN
jgi:hypothetical protein